MKNLNFQKALSITCGAVFATATFMSVVIGIVKNIQSANAVSFYSSLANHCLQRFRNPDGSVSFQPLNIDKSAFTHFEQFSKVPYDIFSLQPSIPGSSAEFGLILPIETDKTQVPESNYNLSLLILGALSISVLVKNAKKESGD